MIIFEKVVDGGGGQCGKSSREGGQYGRLSGRGRNIIPQGMEGQYFLLPIIVQGAQISLKVFVLRAVHLQF